MPRTCQPVVSDGRGRSRHVLTVGAAESAPLGSRSWRRRERLRSRASSWGARAFDWADVQEKTMRPLYDAVLELLDLGPDTMLLDVGCGAGLFASLAAARG